MRTPLVFLALLALPACGSTTLPGNEKLDAGSGGGGGSGGDGGGGAACPEAAPAPGETCSVETSVCSWDNGGDACYSFFKQGTCVGGAWEVTDATHDDCCPDEAPTQGVACTNSPLNGGLSHPCTYTIPCSAGGSSSATATCTNGAWVVSSTCPM